MEMFGPLLLNETDQKEDLYEETPCLICDDKFNLKTSFELYLAHIFEVHLIIIDQVQHIEDLHRYVLYWKERFSKRDLSYLIPSVSVDLTEQKYFLISDLVKEDKELRHRIKLDHVLKVQEFERTDENYKRKCLLCRNNLEGNRHSYIFHLSEQHNLQLGRPENLVFVDELIEKIAATFEALKCLYCKKTFPDMFTLKEHMRKKIHKRINKRNKSYDKYYVKNYLNLDENETDQDSDDGDAIFIRSDYNSDDEYSDWTEKDEDITCLFCSVKERDINDICKHMEVTHGFDFASSTKRLDFYQKVKLVNYIRRQVHNKRCIVCDLSLETMEELRDHMNKEDHYKLPDVKIFDQPEFYFPTYENDVFLYFLEDVEEQE